MPTALLQTKLNRPLARPNLVSRPRLIEKLNESLHGGQRLTLISAPPGFGKTTLLTEWLTQCGCSTAWVSLDHEDNDPNRFLRYIVAALQASFPSVGASVQTSLESPTLPPMESFLTVLINELFSLSSDAILVLDDYHVITADPIHNAAIFLLDNMPPHLHLVIATRVDPPLSLARLRSRNDLTEIRTEDLRFTVVETGIFLREVMGLSLSEAELTSLEARTEGWIAGLQMAALSMQGRHDIDQFVKTFSGSHHYILDYLLEEVLNRQPERVQTFLLQTSILARLNGRLCEAVTGQENGQAMLEQLEKANLFILPLDEERSWYRYHQLFADLLRARLHQSQPDAEQALHGRAATWFEANGFIVEAINHEFQARDFEQAAGLVQKGIVPGLMRGEVATYLTWCNRLPIDIIHGRPWLCVYFAWALAFAGQVDRIESLLENVEHQIRDASDTVAGQTESLPAMLASIRAYTAILCENLPRAAEQARLAREHLPGSDLITRSTVIFVLADVFHLVGDLSKASEALSEVLKMPNAMDHVYIIINTLTELAFVQKGRGLLRHAAGLYREALQLAQDRGGPHFPLIGSVKSGMGDLLWERNDLEAALQWVTEGLEYNKRRGSPNLLAQNYLGLARVLHAKGDVEAAFQHLQEAEQLLQNYAASPRAISEAKACRLNLYIAGGNLAAASRWGQENAIYDQDELGYVQEPYAIARARLLIVEGRIEESLSLLARLRVAAEAGDRKRALLEILGLQALVLMKQGRMIPALASLEESLELGEAEGYLRVYLQEGEPMRCLILKVKKRLEQAGERHDQKITARIHYFERLLAAFPPVEMRAGQLPSPNLIEPLSDRELEVLRLLAAGLSNREIAQRLTVALGTAKAHVHNIYGKLDVQNRTRAIARARELGLI